MSTKAKLLRKKYTGEWRRESEPIAKMMSMFPDTVTKYIQRNSTDRRCCFLQSWKVPEGQIH